MPPQHAGNENQNPQTSGRASKPSSQKSMAQTSMLQRPSMGGAGARATLSGRRSSSVAGRHSMAPMASTSSSSSALVQDMHAMSLSQPAPSHSTMGLGRPSLSAANRRQSQVSMQAQAATTGRRSSAFGSARMSLAGQSGAGSNASAFVKDPRSIRDKQWQYAAIRNLIQLLAEWGYDKTISIKILTAPSGKDFQYIFKFLYDRLDPGYVWGKKKFEEEVPTLIKSLRYPFAEQISRSTLSAVGSPHAWPVCLAMLIWMVELILACETVEQDAVFEEQASQPEQLFLSFLTTAYAEFLQGDDDYSAMEERLELMFRERDQATMEQVGQLKEVTAQLEEELKTLTANPSPLIEYGQQKKALVGDVDKVQKWVEALEAKGLQLTEQISTLKQDIVDRGSDLDQLNRERAELQAAVDAQAISPADVDRMNAERDQLAKSLDQFGSKLGDAKRSVWEHEIATTKRTDSLAYRLGLIPASAPNAQGMNFELRLNSNAIRYEDLISVDLRGTLKTALSNLRQQFSANAIQAEENCLTILEQAERSAETVDQKLEEIRATENHVQKLLEQVELDKETANSEMNAKNAEIEAMERELRRVKVEGTRGLFEAQKNARDVTIEYENLVRRCGEQKEKLVKETLKALEDLVEFKARISGALNGLEKTLMDEMVDCKTSLDAVSEESESSAAADERFRLSADSEKSIAADPSLPEIVLESLDSQ